MKKSFENKTTHNICVFKQKKKNISFDFSADCHYNKPTLPTTFSQHNNNTHPHSFRLHNDNINVNGVARCLYINIRMPFNVSSETIHIHFPKNKITDRKNEKETKKKEREE